MSSNILQRAKCCTITSPEDVRHFVLIGGKWWYNGRKSIELLPSQATADGFWLDSVHNILTTRICSETFESAVAVSKMMLCCKEAKVRVFMREWIPTGETHVR